jgi:hypothetical protein
MRFRRKQRQPRSPKICDALHRRRRSNRATKWGRFERYEADSPGHERNRVERSGRSTASLRRTNRLFHSSSTASPSALLDPTRMPETGVARFDDELAPNESDRRSMATDGGAHPAKGRNSMAIDGGAHPAKEPQYRCNRPISDVAARALPYARKRRRITLAA